MGAAVIWPFAFAFVLHIIVLVSAAPKRTYMVRVKTQSRPASYNTRSEWYSDLFQSLTSAPKDSLLYTYEAAYHGFAASLTPKQAESLRQSDSILGVHEDIIYTLQTTRSPEFLKLNSRNLWPGHTLEQLERASHDVVIGVLDTGVWPESPSFEDGNMPPVPAKWAGKCDPGDPGTPSFCNKKLIGAQFFDKGHRIDRNETRSVRDLDGHGTHTASTVAGSRVANADLLGYAKGSAQGMAPGARLSIYKVCWKLGCYGSDVTAAIDTAIGDGVDVLSISLGNNNNWDYASDPMAVGAFAAMEKGIVVSCSAGNRGRSKATVTNVSPWMITVGAGTIDRDFPAYVRLGNGMKYTGASLYSGPGMGSNPVELVYGGGSYSGSSKLCLSGSLDPSVVRGKMVLCDRGSNARVAKCVEVMSAGGVGMILANTVEGGGGGEELLADSHLCPAVAVGNNIGELIRKYVDTTQHPTTLLSFDGKSVVNVRPSPVVASFSSRGPNDITDQILKPDLIGPGVNILAGWTGALGPTGLPEDSRRTKFNIISGTSMSCPHISGIAALLKAAHPTWSPSAIKSALMTTAYTLDNTNSPLLDDDDNTPCTPWAHGAGYVNPQKAISPGLVYDATPEDYIAMLCSTGSSIKTIQSIVRQTNITCAHKFNDPVHLNYPSFAVLFSYHMVYNYTRELTNVDDDAESIYRVSFQAPPNVTIDVQPRTLIFRKSGEKKRYNVTFTSRTGANLSYSKYPFGFINWVSAKNQVYSPVSFASWWE